MDTIINKEQNIITGVLFIDKPEGITSSTVDKICKRILKANKIEVNKIGHVGTLDPFASGLLPVVLNGATRLIQYFNWNNIKTYLFTVQFGIKTNTGDITGNIIEKSNIIPDIENINNVLPKFIGEIEQVPHAFSAVKINGKKAYELARKGIVPNIKSKLVNIYNLKLLKQVSKDKYLFETTVSSGTYIRSLSEDIAKALGTVGCTIALRRTSIGKFNMGVPLDALQKVSNNINEIVVSVEDLLDGIPVVLISDEEAYNLSLGRSIPVNSKYKNGLYLVKSQNGFLELVEVIDNYMYPKKLIRKLGGKDVE